MASNHHSHPDQDDRPLIVDDCGGTRDGTFVYDEEGVLSASDNPPRRAIPFGEPGPFVVEPIPLYRACSLGTLNGSWLLEIKSTFPFIFPNQVRGPMRVEAEDGILRVSGDVYVQSFRFPVVAATPARATLAARVPATAIEPATVFTPTLVIRRNWYPAFPQNQYRWYFRSTGVKYSVSGGVGKLLFKFRRHLWSTATESFVSEDGGWMEFDCSTSVLYRSPYLPQPTIKMSGQAMIGGRLHEVTATKTSPYYRGCHVEVDVMQNRNWPATAQNCNGTQTFSFTSVYRQDGLDFHVTVNQTNIPQDNNLSIAELHALLAANRSLAPANDDWFLWLLVGSRLNTTGILGIMFDTNNPPHREGAVGFADPVLPNRSDILASARGQALGNVPLAFLRTLIHEAGHAFNLFHPKADVHDPPVTTTIMNQTGDIIGPATSANPYPCNATMTFNEHNRTSLIHSNDPQVKPGWKEFGWGHGQAFGGLPEPTDALGLSGGDPEDADVRLELELPSSVKVGEIIVAKATLINDGSDTRKVSPALNLSETNLKVTVTRPGGQAEPVRDVVYACADQRFYDLAPSKTLQGNLQLNYTNRGHVFSEIGTYEIHAEMDLGEGTIARASATINVEAPRTKKDQALSELMLDEGVGRSLAFGNFGDDKDAEDKLKKVMDSFAGSDTATAAALVLANSLADDFRDLRNQKVVRKASPSRATKALDTAAGATDNLGFAVLTTAIVSPREVDAPVIKDVRSRISGRGKVAALKVFDDHLA